MQMSLESWAVHALLGADRAQLVWPQPCIVHDQLLALDATQAYAAAFRYWGWGGGVHGMTGRQYASIHVLGPLESMN